MSDEWKSVEHVGSPALPSGQGFQPQGAAGNAEGWQTVPSAGQSYIPPQPMPAGFGYPQYTGAPVVVAPQKKSHVARNVILIGLSLFLLGAVGCGALLLKGLSVLRDSKPTQLAVHTAESSSLVRSRIGTPLKASRWVSGSIHTSLEGGVNTGTANLKVNVTGPRGEGTLFANEVLGVDGWKIVSLSYYDQGSETTPLVRNGLPAEQSAPHEELF